MRAMLDTILQSETARSVESVIAALVASVHGNMEAEHISRGVAAARVLEVADLTFLRELKLVVRDGVRIFETYERDTATHGGVRVLDVCRRLAHLYEAFFTGMLDAIQPYAPVSVAVRNVTTADPMR